MRGTWDSHSGWFFRCVSSFNSYRRNEFQPKSFINIFLLPSHSFKGKTTITWKKWLWDSDVFLHYQALCNTKWIIRPCFFSLSKPLPQPTDNWVPRPRTTYLLILHASQSVLICKRELCNPKTVKRKTGPFRSPLFSIFPTEGYRTFICSSIRDSVWSLLQWDLTQTWIQSIPFAKTLQCTGFCVFTMLWIRTLSH